MRELCLRSPNSVRLRFAIVAMSLMFGSAYALSLEPDLASIEPSAEAGSDSSRA